MLDLHPLGEFRDAWPDAGWQAFDGQHELVLPRLQTCRSGGLLAEMEELANLVSDLG